MSLWPVPHPQTTLTADSSHLCTHRFLAGLKAVASGLGQAQKSFLAKSKTCIPLLCGHLMVTTPLSIPR